jgi:hypothetical protein
MVATSLHLELQNIDQMTRQELITAIGSKRECLCSDLLEGLEEESTDRLQLLLLAARLIQVLRHVRSC